MPQIFSYILHRGGVPDDSAAELLAAAGRIDPTIKPIAVLTGWGPDLEAACERVRESYDEVWKLAHEALAYPNAELVRQALSAVLPQGVIVLLPHDHFGIDLAPGLAIKTNAALVSDVVDADPLRGSTLALVRQEFGGQISAHTRCDATSGAVITIRPGAFASRGTESTNQATRNEPAERSAERVVDLSARVGALNAKRRYVGTVVAEGGDVDITKHQVLVSIGRGIQDRDNVSIAQELADAMGAAVSCSRPVVDAKWLDKSRQVGSSGRTVKPKVYLACGISGSFQHLAGIKGSPFIVAINKNPKAPIFRAADVGVVDDVLEFLPALTARIRER